MWIARLALVAKWGQGLCASPAIGAAWTTLSRMSNPASAALPSPFLTHDKKSRREKGAPMEAFTLIGFLPSLSKFLTKQNHLVILTYSDTFDSTARNPHPRP